MDVQFVADDFSSAGKATSYRVVSGGALLGHLTRSGGFWYADTDLMARTGGYAGSGYLKAAKRNVRKALEREMG